MFWSSSSSAKDKSKKRPESANGTTPSALPHSDPIPGDEPFEVEPVDEASLASGAVVLKLRSSASYLPHPDKVSYGGEDAHFISNVGGGAIGVADGVGGWQESGVNPAEYSRTFMRMACAYLEGAAETSGDPDGPYGMHLIDPKGALDAAHQGTKVAGSATAIVMQLDQKRRTFVAANLGDSGFVVLRQGRIFARSKPLQHYFDCPLQFGAFPEYVEATDTVDQADVYQISVMPGDVIVAGSDGLWDNVFDSEIEAMIKTKHGVQEAANCLALLARQHASDPEFASPYIREALSQGLDLPWWDKLFGASWRNGRFQLRQLSGGKQDDITVIVSKVVPEHVAQPPSERTSMQGASERPSSQQQQQQQGPERASLQQQWTATGQSRSSDEGPSSPAGRNY